MGEAAGDFAGGRAPVGRRRAAAAMDEPAGSTVEPMDSEQLVTRLRAAGCVFAEDEAALLLETARDNEELESMVARRVEGLPLEHVLGWVQFAGRRYEIGPGVFVPRPRTEFLVREVAKLAAENAVVLDLCCGSGAVGAALAAEIGAAVLHASDDDPVAVACARHNVENVYLGDLYDGLPANLRGLVDVLVVIAPYVPTAAIELLPHEARDFEPLSTLDGGADGLDVLRRVLSGAGEWLAAGGFLVTEVSERQVPALVGLIEAAGLEPSVIRDDELDATVVIGRYV
jgi:release factor glutamine methyltransferase